jgi:hypothetical protein
MELSDIFHRFFRLQRMLERSPCARPAVKSVVRVRGPFLVILSFHQVRPKNPVHLNNREIGSLTGNISVHRGAKNMGVKRGRLAGRSVYYDVSRDNCVEIRDSCGR